MADVYVASDKRYEKMVYNRVGKSGLKFPAVSLGFWHNFGSKDNYDVMKAMCRTAFDVGMYMEVQRKMQEKSFARISDPTEMNWWLPQKLVMICGQALMVTGEARNISQQVLTRA